ncbi:hypothetical protein BN2537_679 [Streptomyces venezuelae]|nr:hypothetical protein BN2537_679 [Streptomyces venezuelae]
MPPWEQRGSTRGTHAVPTERELLGTLRRNRSPDKKVKLLEARLARRDKEVQSLKEQLAKASRQPAAPPSEGRPATERKRARKPPQTATPPRATLLPPPAP